MHWHYIALNQTYAVLVFECSTLVVFSCNVGDLALFCLDDRHDQYVVFTIGSTLHFLHTDCQEILGLKPSKWKKTCHSENFFFKNMMQFYSCHTNCNAKLFADPGETKKSWVLAEIIEKEYCQAKKVRSAVKDKP
jgi:RB1-inducible coiled-coil protein 1